MGSVAATAQVMPQVRPASTTGCETYDVLFPSDVNQTDITIAGLKECIDDADKLIDTANTSSVNRAIETLDRSILSRENIDAIVKALASKIDPKVEEDQTHLQLKKIYLTYTRLSRWVAMAVQSKDGNRVSMTPEQVALIATYEQFAEDLNLALKAHGLTQPFAANLVTAFSFATASKAGAGGDTNASAKDSGTPDTSKSSGAGYVEFESLHFFARPRHMFDIDVMGTIGFRPTLVVVVPSDAANSSTRSAQYQSAFVWSIAAEPNFKIADLSEIGAVATIGETILSSSSTLLENGANSQVAVVTGANDSDSAFFWELAGKIGIFAESLDLLHLSKGLLSPMFGVTAGVRRDQRFRGLEIDGGRPHQDYRYFIRLSTNAIPMTDSARPDKTFSLTFAVEYEKPMFDGTGAIPHGTRVLIRGDLNLFKATGSK
jgi:hypothetical protein